MDETLAGLWQPVYAELGGEEAPKMMLDKMEVELTEDHYTVRFGGETYDRGTYAVDAEGITLRGTAGTNAGRTIPCIFKFSGGALSICYGLDGARPDNFTTAGDRKRYLVNYRRKER